MSMVGYQGEAAIGLCSRDLNERWFSPERLFRAIPDRTATQPSRSRFESMVLQAGTPPPKARDILGVLLASTCHVQGHGSEVLHPLWADEAMHRAYNYVRLVDIRNRRGQLTSEDPVVALKEAAIAGDLAVRLSDLAVSGEREVLPCSAILRDAIAGLGALFGDPANVTVKAKIEEVRLAGYKRRAMVLAASELVSNALLHAFEGCMAGRIEVGLAAHGPKSACLRVADNGIGFAAATPAHDCGVAAGLADLLEADLTYDRIAGWTIAEISFPVSGPQSVNCSAG